MIPPIAPSAPPRGRNTTYDTLRGLLLVIMAVNHVPSFIGWLTRQPVGFMTAAEGFIFISGLVVGLVYSKRWSKAGPRATTRLLVKRGFVIYRAHIICVAVVLAWMLAYRHFMGRLPVSSPWPWMERPLLSIPAVLLLLNQPGLLDVLPTYCALLVITPVALRGFFAGKEKWALALSCLLWEIANLLDPPHPLISGPINTGAFNFFAWQFLYVIGLFAGWRRHATGPAPQPAGYALDGVLLCVVLFLSLCRHGVITPSMTEATWFALTNKNNLAPLRMANTLAVIALAGRWLARREGEFSIRPLAFLGRHSLCVFAVHCVVVIVMLGLPEFFEWSWYCIYLDPVVVVLLLFAAAWLAEWYRRQTKGMPTDFTHTVPLAWEAPGGGPVILYRWHTPRRLRKGVRHPLVLFFHGAGERGDDNRAQLANGVLPFLETAGKLGRECFLIAPQCPADARWVLVDEDKRPPAAGTPNGVLEAVLGLVRETIARHAVDPRRIYVTGLSMGGYAAWDLPVRAPGLFAAAAPVCGGGDPAGAKAMASLPVHAFHGADDSVIPVERTTAMIAAMKNAGGHPLLTIYPETGHDAWSRAYADESFVGWLFRQRRDDSAG